MKCLKKWRFDVILAKTRKKPCRNLRPPEDANRARLLFSSHILKLEKISVLIIQVT